MASIDNGRNMFICYYNLPADFPRDKEPPKFEDMRSGGIGLAVDLVPKKKFNEARQVLAKLLELGPDDVEVMSLLGNAYSIKGSLAKAEEWLGKPQSTNPNYTRALYHMGEVCHEKEEFEKAMVMFERAIEHLPQDKKEDIADAYQDLGCSFLEFRRREDALEACPSFDLL